MTFASRVHSSPLLSYTVPTPVSSSHVLGAGNTCEEVIGVGAVWAEWRGGEDSREPTPKRIRQFGNTVVDTNSPELVNITFFIKKVEKNITVGNVQS